MCKTNGCTQNCSCDEKHFTSEINYDGAKIPCLDPEGTIRPPYTGLNTFLQYLATKLCDLIALGGIPGDAFTYETINEVSASLTGSAGATSSVTSVTAWAMKNGKYHTVNYDVELLVNGSIGQGLVLDIDLTTYLTNTINNNYFNSIYFEPFSAVILPQTRYMTAASGQKKLVSSSYKLNDTHTDTVINIYGQISFYEF